jgi:hypothetical protein
MPVMPDMPHISIVTATPKALSFSRNVYRLQE